MIIICTYSYLLLFYVLLLLSYGTTSSRNAAAVPLIAACSLYGRTVILSFAYRCVRYQFICRRNNNNNNVRCVHCTISSGDWIWSVPESSLLLDTNTSTACLGWTVLEPCCHNHNNRTTEIRSVHPSCKSRNHYHALPIQFDLFVPQLYCTAYGVSTAMLYCNGGGNREDRKMIRKETEPNTIQHNTHMMMMMIMMITNTYVSADVFFLLRCYSNSTCSSTT